METEEIQQLQSINFLSEQNNAKVVSFSSELQNAQAANILSSNRKNIWMTEEGMPQHMIIDISKLAERPKFFKCVAFDCWHDYKTNPSIIEFLVSTDNVKEYITWSTIYLELKEGLQVFQIDPLGRRYDFIKETYGGAKTYLNQILLFEDNPFGNKQPPSQQQQSNSQALLLRNKANVQDLSMNIDSEMDEKYFNARLNIPKPFPNQINSHSNNNTLNTQSNNLITQTNQTLPDQNNINNLAQQQPHPANLPSINYPMYNNSDRRQKHNSVNSIKKRSLVSSPSEELLHYQGNIHQSGNNTQTMGMNGQFFHTPSHSNHNINSQHHLQSNQGMQPLDSIQKQLYQIQQQSIPGTGSSAMQSVRGMINYQQQQPQINNSELDQIQQNLHYKLQNMNKEIMSLNNDQPSEVIMDHSSLTPVNQDDYAELHKHLFGQQNQIQHQQQHQQQQSQQQQQRENNQILNNNNLFDKMNTSGYKQQDGGQLVSNKTSQISQLNNNLQQHNISQHSNLNAKDLIEDNNSIPPHLLTQSEKEVLALKKMVLQLKDEHLLKDNQMKKLEQTILNLQFTCQNLVEKLESLENKFENFKQQSRNLPSYRRTTQPDEKDEDNANNFVLETNQKQNFPLNSPQTFGKNFSLPIHNHKNSEQKFDEYNSYNHPDQEYDTQQEKVNKIIEQKLDQFQKVIMNTLKKNFSVHEQEQYEHQNMQPVRSSQSIQNKGKHQNISQQENYDLINKQKTKSRQNSNNSRNQKSQDLYQPPSFNSNSRNEILVNQRQSHNQSGMDQYLNKNMGNRSNSNHSQQNVSKQYRSISKNQEYSDRHQVPLTQVQSNKQFNTEPNRSRMESQQNPRVVKLLEKLQEKLTIRQKKVEQLNSGKKNKKDYYDRDFDEISDIQEGTSSGQQSRLFD